MANSKTPFSAAPTAIGYLFQCRYALLESLRRLREDAQFVVSIETLDDVVFERDGEPPALLQTKHHIEKIADLTHTSPALWKTIRIWCEGFINGDIPDGSACFLITTGEVPGGCPAYYLKGGSTRDVLRALEHLNATARTSKSKANRMGYDAFLSLSADHQRKLFASVCVIDAAPSIENLEAELRKEVILSIELQFLDSFLQWLEGWWLQRIIQHLTDIERQSIPSMELFAEIWRLQEQFRRGNLPIDDDIVHAVVSASGYQDRTFVRQLQLIEVSANRIIHAIRNYFRAFEHRSRWIREELLLVGDLDRYEDRLFEEWEIRFEKMRDGLDQAAPETAKKEAANSLYDWIEEGSLLPIRTECLELFIARGTYQILADKERIGWHPQFVERLREFVEL